MSNNQKYQKQNEILKKDKNKNLDSCTIALWFYSFYLFIPMFFLKEYSLFFLILYLLPPFDALVRIIFPFLNIKNNSSRKLKFSFVVCFFCVVISSLLHSEFIITGIQKALFLILVVFLISFIPCILFISILKFSFSSDDENTSTYQKMGSSFLRILCCIPLLIIMLLFIFIPLAMLMLGTAGS